MELKNDFRVGVPPQTASNVLSDIERSAPAPTDVGPADIGRVDGPEVEPVDLLDAAGGSLAERALPAVVGSAAMAAMAALVVPWRRPGR
jgi:hypothetical protein